MKKHQSHYDPSRPTVGKIYRDLHLGPTENVIVGDMSNEMMKGLVEDINDAVKEGLQTFNKRPFYILVHEKKDLQMKDAFLRRVIKQLWRPYPEDDTTVFYHDPKKNETFFCWSLPHWSEMGNILNSIGLFDKDLVEEVTAWRRNDLHYFGFMKDEQGNWMVNPRWKDKPLKKVA